MTGVKALCAQSALYDALARARSRVEASAFMAAPDFRHALEDAARRGVAVTLRLCGRQPADGEPVAALAAQAAAMRAAGVRVVMDDGARIRHLKAVVIDDREAFLADRNFARDETLVRTDDVRAVTRAIVRGSARSRDVLLDEKGRVLRLEADLVSAAPPGTDVLAVTEYAGPSLLARALLERAGDVHATLVVGRAGSAMPLEAETLADLAAHGVRVVIANTAEKGICVGDIAIVTSANATPGQPSMSEWAARFDGVQAQTLRDHFAQIAARASDRKTRCVLE